MSLPTHGRWRAVKRGAHWAIVGPGAEVLAETPRGERSGEGEANAQLMAAAPDLLAACESAVAFVEAPSKYRDADEAALVLRAIRAATLKAAGA